MTHDSEFYNIMNHMNKILSVSDYNTEIHPWVMDSIVHHVNGIVWDLNVNVDVPKASMPTHIPIFGIACQLSYTSASEENREIEVCTGLLYSEF